MPLTPEQVTIVKSTVPVLQIHGDAITKHFYKIVIDENPALNGLFNKTNQDTNHQPAALATSLYAYAKHIDDLGKLAPAVEKICRKHASLYIQAEHYDVVGTYLLRAMGEVLGDALTPTILEAWAAAYWQLANLMIGREAELYKASEGWTSWRDFRIARKETESTEITSFYLEPVDGKALPSFIPGQYISIRVDVPELQYSQPRQYSLSEQPNTKYYRISPKRHDGNASEAIRPGYVSNILHNEKKVGDIIQVSHPEGEFPLAAGKKSAVVMISAGVGLTPMISILNDLVTRKSDQQISWIYGTRSSEAQAFGSHVQKLAGQHGRLHTTIFNRNPAASAVEGVDYHHTSRVDLDLLDKERQLFLGQDAEYFVSGPDGFMYDVVKKLKIYGIPDENVHCDRFGVGFAPTAG